jgi:phosphoribosylaminoimidazole-succinocarboxamide synthase
VTTTVFESSIRSLPLIARGKVRDIYAVGADKLLIVTSDRLSAFDVILPNPIPDKGKVLTQTAAFWFEKLKHIVANQLTGIDPETVVGPNERAQVRGRAIVVKRLQPLPIEAVVRGYLIGSGWKDYQQTGAVCGIKLPAGLKQAAKLPEPIFTPATKADIGEHDENISFEEAQSHCAAVMAPALQGTGKNGAQLAAQARDVAIALYNTAADYARTRGIIIADTKFEFGIDTAGTLHLIDEALTPDSSRFWPADGYREGISPPSFDKQYVRDYLETLAWWNKVAPGPQLPDEVVGKTAAKYREAYERLTGEKLK